MEPTQAEWPDLIRLYLAWAATRGNRPSTARLRDYHLRTFAEQTGLAPLAVTGDDVAAWLDGKDWARGTLRSWRSTLDTFYGWAVRTKRLDVSPVADLPPAREDRGRKREPASDIAVAWGLRSHDPRVVLATKLGGQLAMRPGEIARACREDLFADLIGWSIVVHGKGGRVRNVPVPEPLASELRRLPDGPMLVGIHGRALTAGYVSRIMSAGMPDGQTGHMLRHRRAAKAYQRTGHDIRAVQELLGHASVATTQIYVPVEPEQVRLAVGGEL